MLKRRPLLTAVLTIGFVVFLAISLIVGRWLNADTVERDRIEQLLASQARGDADAMLRELDCPDRVCINQVRINARRLKARGQVEIARFDSKSSHALTSTIEPTRVVWITPGKLTTVQCITVRREGGLISGPSISLLRVSAPIERESSCE